VTTAETIRQPRGAFTALSSRSYRIYIGGQSLTNTGSWMQSIAQDWLIFDLTHSSTAVGITMALQFLPILLFGLHTGLVADRLSKRSILLATQTLNATAASAHYLHSPKPGPVLIETELLRAGRSARAARTAPASDICTGR